MQLAACCLNISEGRDRRIVESIAYASVVHQDRWVKDKTIHTEDAQLRLKYRAAVISVYSDETFNRSNLTITAPIEYLSSSVYQACEAAFSSIDLNLHRDVGHPRLGAVDLIPIHPLTPVVSVKTCGVIAHNIADKLGKNIDGVSMFYYGVADTPRGRGLVEQRKRMNWFKSGTNIEGYDKHRGLTAIGATPYMSVLNVLLETYNLDVGSEIASSVRSSNQHTGLPGIQAMAFRKPNGIEIACNVDTTDLQNELPVFQTSFEELETEIRRHAFQRNVATKGTSLRGFTPSEAYSIAVGALSEGHANCWEKLGLLRM